MYEDTEKKMDWKGLFLKAIIVCLVVLIAVKGYSLLKGNDNKVEDNNPKDVVVDKNTTSTFTANMEKLRNAGKAYFEANGEKLPKVEGGTSMVTLNDLINKGNLTALTDEEGKNCDGESSYVIAMLEGKEYKLKANLVCGNSSSYSLVYLDSYNDNENDTNNVSSTTNTSSNTSTNKTNTNVSTGKNNCSTCGTSVNVQTNTSVNNKVTVNGNETTSKPNSNNNYSRYYTVKFDSNGGNKSYRTQTVKENGYAYNPGTNTKSGYRFLGWYLNGYKFDFNTVITKDITLVAKYEKIYGNDDDYDYDDDYYTYYTVRFDSNGGKKTYSTQTVKRNEYAYNPGTNTKSGYKFLGWYLNGKKFDFDTPITRNIILVAKYSKIYDDEDDYDYQQVQTKTLTTKVYSMGYFDKGTPSITINHTLRLPEELNKSSIVNIRIKKIDFYSVIDSRSELQLYESKHPSTFIYEHTSGDYPDTMYDDPYNTNTLAKVNTNSLWFNYNTAFVTRANTGNGFDVNWGATRISSQCSDPFTNAWGGKSCNVGIVYKVTWEYQQLV